MANNLQSPPEPIDTASTRGTLEDDVQSPPEPSKTTLVKGIIADAQHLIQQQLAMFRQEIRDDLRKGKEAGLSLAAGVGIALAGIVLVLVMLPLLLHWIAPELALWACFGIVGAVITALGGVLVFVGVKKFESFNPLSDKSIEAFKENLKWTVNPR
jgi:hypothetical protein